MRSKALTGLLSLFIGISGVIFFPSHASANCLTNDDIQGIRGEGTYVTCGGDDDSYRVPIVNSVVFGGVSYSDVYATTNSTITFGQADNNFSSFPVTPSISFQAWDWVEGVPGGPEPFGAHDDEYFNITTTNSGFVIDLSARPFGNYFAGQLIHNVLAFVRNHDGTLRIQSFTSSSNQRYRNGCVLHPGAAAVDFDTCGITQQVSLTAILELVDQITNNEVPVVEGDRRDPIQQSRTDAISGISGSDQTLVDIKVNGNFIENIVTVTVNGEKLPFGSWIQGLTSVTFSAPKSKSDVYEVQLYNAAVPLVDSQSFTLIG